MKQATALQLVKAPKSSRVKKETKSEVIARLEKNLVQLTTDNSELSTKVEKLENPEQSEVIETVKTAFRKKNVIAALLGCVKGGWAPVASYDIVHHQLPKSDGNLQYALTVLVVGALLFSAPNVYQWCKAAFNSAAKALGFVVLVEGVLVFGQSAWLSYSALALLIAMNAIQSACNLALRQKKEFEF